MCKQLLMVFFSCFQLYFVVGFVFLQVLNVLVKKPKAEKPKEQ